jgi:FecR-like protein
MGTRPMVTAKLSLPLAAATMLCLLAPSQILAQMPAPIDSGQYAAKAIQVTGRVSVLRDSIEYAIVEGGEVHVKELIFTGSDGQARFQVSDGSTFDVYPNSRVIFRKNVPNWRDLLDVLVGRVKVHIEHWGNQPNHNRVLTPTAVISVRGTTFDITVDDDDETTVVEVEEGVVEVQHALLPGGSPRILNTGESLRVYRNEPIASGHIDKGEVFKRVARMAIDALSTLESRVRVAGGASGSSGSAGGVGDTKRPGPPTSTTAPGVPGVGAAPPPPPPGGGTFINGGQRVYVHTQQQSQTRWQKVRNIVMRTAMRVLLGTSPEDEVVRVAGQM